MLKCCVGILGCFFFLVSSLNPKNPMFLTNIYRVFHVSKHKYHGGVLHFLKEAWRFLLDYFCLKHVNQWNTNWNKGAIINWSNFSIPTRMCFLLKYSWSWYRLATCETLLSFKDLWKETTIRAEEVTNDLIYQQHKYQLSKCCLPQNSCRSGQSLMWILITISFKRLFCSYFLWEVTTISS